VFSASCQWDVLDCRLGAPPGGELQLGEQDYNHYNLKVNGALSPVIPVCTSAQLFVRGRNAPPGPITVWTDQGRSVYDALLLKVVKALSNHTQFTWGMHSKKAWTRVRMTM